MLIFLLLSASLFGQQNYFDLEDNKRIDKGLQSQDPYGINEPLMYQGDPDQLRPYQDIWRPAVPQGRMPTSDQDTLSPYNLDKPGLIRDW
ncbi:MAG: hypothetical protein DRQ88_12305 [Epsilonproteobacteria bacterium]|nr:MAG: hypothetical protein DRQ88_12305 [Campylobacterota bacterium]RLA64787.1 MAG: hypothetical protein DRQ89_02925 [Campylobacterota bacterium]